MRIGLFSHVYPPLTNGISTSVKALENELKNQGHEVFVITNNYDAFKNDFSDSKNLKIVSIPLYYQNLKTPILYNPDLFRKLDELNLDVIHSHSDFGLGVLSRIYAFSNDKPHIQTYHCNYIDYANENFGRLLGFLAKNPVKLYTTYLSKTTNRLIVPSTESLRLLKEEFKLKEKIDLIPNGIDLDKFHDVNFSKVTDLRKKYNILENDFVLLVVSRLSKEKRIDEIIKMLGFLTNCPNLKLLIVGSGPDEENLKKLVSELQLPNVIFTGEIKNEEIAPYYRLATTFITNSIAETQGLTVIEALASSIPVISINHLLYQELVKDNINGIKYNNIEELIKLIQSLYENRDFIEKMRRHTELSVARFSIREVAKEILEIYNEELDKKSK